MFMRMGVMIYLDGPQMTIKDVEWDSSEAH